MNVKTRNLIPGCILADDVYKKSNTPLLRKKTILTEEHLHMLSIFFVKRVKVEPILVNGEVFKPGEEVEEVNEELELKESDLKHDITEKEDTYIDYYLRAVQQFKRLFNDWQGGVKVDAFAVRNVFLPLYEQSPTKNDLMQLHHYSTKQDYIYFHSVAVSVFSTLLGKRLGLKNGEVMQLGIAGLLADCGMAKLPFNAFEKKSSLTAEQYEEVKKHPIIGYRMLEETQGLTKNALVGILQHHEREDGSGYPLKVRGSKLHQYAKVIAIADVFHAMTSERYYRSKQSPYKVIDSLKVDQFGKLDHSLLNHLIHLTVDLSIGTKVRLNSGAIGEVLYQNSQHPTRPILKLIDEGDALLDLLKHPDIIIEEELVDLLKEDDLNA
ncbi:HD-GYP domain-containing protein [Salipaludibacillus sp. LMS25]|uniref:HD-GYP domain-containing protein n=1 Tax=Salipaludibacillus sp. LMS25 TaxID=2924031 RepID=UPI0020D0DA81|nr:HD-GYP domain-containing protein [Salipaludibacillus sp. LMS25]UTR16594.1 HD-GYP domain-containing protein [Salipaludibacillus sp. LMS25]